MANVSKKALKDKLGQMLKSKDENIYVFGLKTKFGGGRSSGFACVYDNLDARKKFETKTGLRRVRLAPFLFNIIGRHVPEAKMDQEAEEGNQGESQ